MLIEARTCPTCGTFVDKDFDSKVKHLVEEYQTITKEKEQYDTQKKDIQELIEKLNYYNNKLKETKEHESFYNSIKDDIDEFSRI